MITVNRQIFNIQAGNMSLILGIRHGYVIVKHFGQAIPQYTGSNSLVEKDHAFSGGPFSYDRTFSLDTQQQVVGQLGKGDFRRPSLIVEHHQNQVTDFKFHDYEVSSTIIAPKGLPAPRPTKQSEMLRITLLDEVAQLKLHLYYITYPEFSTIGQFCVLENIGDEAVTIHKLLSTMLDLPSSQQDVITLQGYYGKEKSVVRQKIQQGIYEIGSIRGSSGHGQTPALIIADATTTDDFGEVFSFNMMYSGNFEAFVQKNQLSQLRIGLGIHPTQFAWQLQPNEQFETPFVIMNHTLNGLNHLSQLSQQMIQSQIVPVAHQYQLRPILINNWEATYFDFNLAKLQSLVDVATKVGVELFVLDDGWFGRRQDDRSSLGDWLVNTEKLGGDLSALIAYVHQKGLKFGLWIEPEMISEDSELYRQHPEWVIQAPNREITYSRSQWVLNLANPAVVAYLQQTFDELLTTYEIDYIKWDSNRNISDLGNGASYLQTLQQSHEYMLGLYELVAYLKNRHETVLFESCSGGGGRNDLGMMAYFDQVWASDNTDAIERLSIQYGSTYLLPVIQMGAHVSASPNHQMNRVTPLATRGHVAMMGNLGYELDLTKMTDEQLQAIADQIAHYKKIRPIIQLGKQIRLLNPVDNAQQSTNYTALQQMDEFLVVVTVVKTLSTIEIIEPTLKLKELDIESEYRLLGTEIIYSGAELMYAGITLNFASGDFMSQQYVFEKLNQ